MAEFAYSAIIGTPATYEDAIKSEDSRKWRKSMDDEIGAHQSNQTWSLVPSYQQDYN